MASRTGAGHREHAEFQAFTEEATLGALNLYSSRPGALTDRSEERHRLSAEEAFSVLSRASQQTNAKLREVARQVTETGQAPGVT